MKMRKFITYCFFCLVLFLQNSCVTKALWGDRHYDETIHQFYVGSDGRYVVLIGNKFHYVFEDDSNLFKMILSLKQRETLTVNPGKSHLKLDSHHEISGHLVIDGPFEILPQQDIRALEYFGIRPDKDDNLYIKIPLSGKRYQATSNINSRIVPTMATDYKLPIYYYDSNFVENIAKVAVTPVALGLDTVVLIGDVILYPLDL